MANNMDKTVDSLLSSPMGEKLSSHKSEIERLAASNDGQKVQKMMEQNNAITRAVEKGDTEALKAALSGILSTKEGARLAKSLSDMMK